MARQKYNYRQVNLNQPSRIKTSAPASSKYDHADGYACNSNRNIPSSSNSKPKACDAYPLQVALFDWLLNELDRWFYTAMKFQYIDTGTSFNSIFVYDNHSLNHLCSISFDDNQVTIAAASRFGIIYVCGDLSRNIQYSDPDLLDLIQDGIRRIYNYVR